MTVIRSPDTQLGGRRRIAGAVWSALLVLATCGCDVERAIATQSADGAEELSDAISMDCSNCPAVGGQLSHLLCAVDLCDPDVVLGMSYGSPATFTECSLEDTYEAVPRFGDATNDLAPRLGSSYALMATGLAEGQNHDTFCSESIDVLEDEYDPTGFGIFDAVEWRLELRAPDEARGFRFDYVFFSAEFDEYIGSEFNDRFYAVLEAPSTKDPRA